MICLSISSVVRLIVPSLLSLALSACTVQHTRDLSHTALRNVGLSTSVSVQRTATWSLPHDTKVYLEPVVIAGVHREDYPRLRNHLDNLLESIALEWFQSGGLSVGQGAELASGVRIRVGLAAAQDQLSSVRELADNRGLGEQLSGRDRLFLVMRIYDARSGRLLDSLSAEAVGGWQWGEHRVETLAEPTLRSMFAHLKGISGSPE